MIERRRHKGSQTVEFALALPFFVLILYAVLDFGMLVYNKAIITNASREAARAGVILTAATWSPSAIAQVACNYAQATLITVNAGTRTATCSGSADPVISVNPSSAPSFNTPVSVSISYEVRGFSLGSWWGLGTGTSIGSPITLTATTQMNHE
ncbi:MULTISPECIES: TadE/TadG family type IV pilus assembly protein [Ramlibacter]|uniref:Pilus assembly protein n=1 Tax=Ramlibacter aquaticus TaxID=2780094 RepID=A0ABR9SJA1_9BURK|nr:MULTISPECIES: TadE/TadG family type IV pilus assembly protein [Ramlibacter]MBE7942378.1 pilus assembly protein [Ramlibacter aquaticus]